MSHNLSQFTKLDEEQEEVDINHQQKPLLFQQMELSCFQYSQKYQQVSDEYTRVIYLFLHPQSLNAHLFYKKALEHVTPCI